MAELLYGSGDVQRHRPGRAGLGRAAEDDRAGGLCRPRRLEGHGVAGNHGLERWRDAVGQVGGQIGDGPARRRRVTGRQRSAQGKVPGPGLSLQHLEGGDGPLRGEDLGKVGLDSLLRRAADHRVAAGTDRRAYLEGDAQATRIGRPDTDLGVADDVDL